MMKTVTASIIFDDIDWNQAKEENGLVTSDGKQILGGSYISVEKFNEQTTALLGSISVHGKTSPHLDRQKPSEERWYQDILTWNVNEEIQKKYGVQIKIEQGSLHYRGTWIEVIAESHNKSFSNLKKTLEQFCEDYNFNSRKKIEATPSFPYDLPWPEGQKNREDEDDKTDFFFDSLD